MDFKNLMLLLIIGAAVFAGVYWVATHFFSADARWERRRRRSHSPITSTSNRPSVKLSVKTKKERRK